LRHGLLDLPILSPTSLRVCSHVMKRKEHTNSGNLNEGKTAMALLFTLFGPARVCQTANDATTGARRGKPGGDGQAALLARYGQDY